MDKREEVLAHAAWKLIRHRYGGKATLQIDVLEDDPMMGSVRCAVVTGPLDGGDEQSIELHCTEALQVNVYVHPKD